MFALEFVGARPPAAAPYFALTVRDRAYSIGRLATCDIALDLPDVSRQHATIMVLRRSRAQVGIAAGGDDGADGAAKASVGTAAVLDSDPLVLLLTNHSKFATAVGERLVASSAVVSDGAEIRFGATACLRVSYRPLIVSVARDFADEFVAELEDICDSLGATVTREFGPVPVAAGVRPIGMLHCAEEIADDSWTLQALAVGYSIMRPNYVFEFFGALSESATLPLQELPPPVDFEPWRKQSVFGSARYLRPECGTCAFPLYPLPPECGLVERSRRGLFAGRIFALANDVAAQRNGPVIALCSGTSVSVDAAIGVGSASLPSAASHMPRIVLGRYVVVDRDQETVIRERGLGDFRGIAALVDPSPNDEGAAGEWQLIPERSLHVSLLCNEFTADRILFPRRLAESDAGAAADEDRPLDRDDQDRASEGAVPLNDVAVRHNDELFRRLAARKVRAHLGDSAPPPPEHLGNAEIEIGGCDVDSDATPSSAGVPVATGESDAGEQDGKGFVLSGKLARGVEGMLGARARNMTPTTTVFTAQFEMARQSILRLIAPEIPRLTNASRAARKTRFVGAATLDYVRGVEELVAIQLRGLEHLAVAPDGATHARALQQLWDTCDSARRLVADVLRTSSGLRSPHQPELQGNMARPSVSVPASTSRSSPSAGAFHVIPATSSQRTDFSSAALQQVRPSPNPAPLGAAQRQLPTTSLAVDIVAPGTGGIRDGTRVVRYPAPPALRASGPDGGGVDGLSVRHRSVEQEMAAKLLLPVAPAELATIAARRKAFMRVHGSDEGEKRFRVWLSAQPLDWTADFHRHLHLKKLTLYELFTLPSAALI